MRRRVKFEEFDVVRLVRPAGDYGLPPGATGTVVLVYSDPSEAYEVEFVEPDGSTAALLTLQPQELEPAKTPGL